jgi:hypothetical protein
MPIFITWMVFRVLSSIFVALLSSIRPMTPLELALPLLPPASPLTDWLDRAFLSPWLRWDSVWYLRIVEHGYDSMDGTAQFHPLYPWLATLLSSIGIHPLLSLLMVSSIASFGFLWMFAKLALNDLPSSDIQFSLIFMLLAPTAFIIFAPYSEALFLLCSVCAFYMARKRRWWLASLFAALAVLTRQQGLLLIFPIGLELLASIDFSWRKAIKSWNHILSLSLIPLGYGIWLLYRSFFLNDLKFDLTSLHSFIYSFFISRSASEVVPVQRFLWPWQAIWLAIQKFVTKPDLDLGINFFAAGIFLVFVILGWRKMRTSDRIYCVLITLLSFSYHTGPIHPYMGLPRHLLLAFPVYLASAPLINRPVIRPIAIFVLGTLFFFMLLLFSFEAWVP